MKILLISSTFPPRKFGGITASSYILAKNLVKRKHDVTVYTTDISDRYSRIPDTKGVKNMDGIEVYYFKNLSNWLASLRLYSPIGMITAIKRKLNKFDIIHLNEFRSFQSIIVHRYAKRYGIPYVLQARGSLPRIMTKQRLKRIYDILWGYRLLRDASKVVALTQIEAEQYKSMGVSQDGIEIVPNGIDLAEFENLPQRGEFRKKWRINNSQKIVLFLSRINKIKGPDLLARAFATLLRDFDNIKLVIVGPDDGYLTVLKKLIQELNIEEKVLFTGLLHGRDKLAAYIDADVYVLPSAYEIFGRTLLEACACGTPIIVTDRCGIADVIDGQAGLAVPYDKDALGKALRDILNDDQMRRQFGERGKLLVREKFNWEKISQQVEDIYESCVSA